MNIFITKLNHWKKQKVTSIIILALITISFQNPAFANEDKEKIVALTNWATIEYSNLFLNNYEGPLSALGYRYTYFPDSDSYIGIKEGNLDVLIDGETIPIGSVEDIMATMAASNNGILNLSGTPISSGIIPSIFSPGNGKLLKADSQTSTVEWVVTAAPEKCILTVIFNIADSSILSLTLNREIEGSNNATDQWSLSNSDNTPLKGAKLDFTTLKITEDLVLERVSSEAGTLTISAGGTLIFSF